MAVEHGNWKRLGRPGLGPNTLRRLVGGSLGNPDTSRIMESLASMGSSLGTLVEGLSSAEQKPKDEKDSQH